MTALVRSEIFKLRTTRTFYGLVGAALALLLLGGILHMTLSNFSPGDRPVRQVQGLTDLLRVFALMLGILSVTSEFRHGTITASVLVVPSRVRLVAAKLLATLLVGITLGLALTGIATLFTAGIASARGIPLNQDGKQIFELILGGTVATALTAALGVGVGAIVRNQVGAIIGGLVYLFLIENLVGLIPGLDKVLPKYGLNGVGASLSGINDGDNALRQLPAGLLLALYTVVLVVAGTIVVSKRDISA